MVMQLEPTMRSCKLGFFGCAVAMYRREHASGIAMMLRLMLEILSHSVDAHPSNASSQITTRPNRSRKREFASSVAFECLNDFRDCVSGSKAEKAQDLVALGATLQQVVVMSCANLVEQFDDGRGERFTPAMCAKTDVIVKLISPCEACVGCEVHHRRIRVESLKGKVGVNNPPTAVGGIHFFPSVCGRWGLKDPPTAVGGIYSKLITRQTHN